MLVTGYFLFFNKAVGFFIDVFAEPNGDNKKSGAETLQQSDKIVPYQ